MNSKLLHFHTTQYLSLSNDFLRRRCGRLAFGHRLLVAIGLATFCTGLLLYSLSSVDSARPLSTSIDTSSDKKEKVPLHVLLRTDRLGQEDWLHFKYCAKRTRRDQSLHTREDVQPKPLPEPICHFMNGRKRHPVALASFPGSGNTWLRGLLQKATGVCTGGVYCDPPLRSSEFPGDSVRSGAVLVVKTHDSSPRWVNGRYSKQHHPNFKLYGERWKSIPVFGSAVFLVRSPFEALVSEWNRLIGENSTTRNSHVTQAGPQHFREHEGWDRFVTAQTMEWVKMLYSYLVLNHHNPVLTVRYEDLLADPAQQVWRILNFLEMPMSRTDIEQRLWVGYEEFHRRKSKAGFDHFTAEQRERMQAILQNATHLLDSIGMRGESGLVQSYCWSY